MRVAIYFVLICNFLILRVSAGKRKLTATSLVTCSENSQISAKSFNVLFNPDNLSLHYNLDLTTEISGYVSADIEVFAYGFKIISKNIDLCSINLKQFCPVYPGDVQIDSIENISSEYVKEIPGIAYLVPDIDAYARIRFYSDDDPDLACIQVFFSNGKTVSQTGVQWVTAIVAGTGLLLSAVLSTFGNSTAASHVAANTVSLFLYFQSVVIVAMEHVHRVPPIAAAWSENLVWSMGLIKVDFMQNIFRWYIASTGGVPTLHLTSKTVSILTQRGLGSLAPLYKRANNVLYGNANTLIFRGIERLAYRIGIENSSVVVTGFTFFVLCGYILAGIIIECKLMFDFLIKIGWLKQTRFLEFRRNWRNILKGALLRYIFIGFTQVTIFSFWEFTRVDSPAVVVIACLLLILSLGLMIWCAFRTVSFAKKSIKLHNNPAALLYGDETVLNRYGFFYTMFNARHYWWNIVILCYILLRSVFIGFVQVSGKTQAISLFIIDLSYFVSIIKTRPYLDRPTNIMNILITTVTLVNSFLFMFFSDLFGQPYYVSAIMGWIFFVLNAGFSFVLLLMILAFTGLVVFSKNPDLRFKPAKDDRASFQRYKNKNGYDDEKFEVNELKALAEVANGHNEYCEAHLHKNQDSVNERSYSNIGLDQDPFNEDTSSTQTTGSSNEIRHASRGSFPFIKSDGNCALPTKRINTNLSNIETDLFTSPLGYQQRNADIDGRKERAISVDIPGASLSANNFKHIGRRSSIDSDGCDYSRAMTNPTNLF